MTQSFLLRVVEEKIREAQETGAFDNLPGRGKPLELEDLSPVPEDLRMAYHCLRNAHLLPPEVELLREVQTLEDLLKTIGDEEERGVVLKRIEERVVRLDLLKRRSFSVQGVRYYAKRLTRNFADRHRTG
ncbi:MAG: DUF1992 domain-containing protein [Candidatus Binatia bacterium]